MQAAQEGEMGKTVTVVFDGHVLRPDASVDLEPNRRYVVTIERMLPTEGDAWDVLEALTGTVQAPADWAKEHNHYLYGTHKCEDERGT